MVTGVNVPSQTNRVAQCRSCKADLAGAPDGTGAGAPRTEQASLRVCGRCFEGFRRNLFALPGLYRQCEEMLTVTPRKGEKVSRTVSRGISLNSMAMDARGVIRARLLAWSDLVAAERPCPAPDRSVQAMARFLRANAAWLGAHPAAGDAVDEIAETTAAARRAAYPDHTRRFRVGPCIEPGCGGDLVAVIQPYDQLLPSEVRCDIDPEHTWPAHRWRELDRLVGRRNAQLTARGERWLTAAEVSSLWGLSTSNVYRLASVNSWRRRANGRRVYYYEADVLQSVG